MSTTVSIGGLAYRFRSKEPPFMNNTPVKTGVLGLCRWGGDGPNGYGQVVPHFEMTSNRSSTS